MASLPMPPNSAYGQTASPLHRRVLSARRVDGNVIIDRRRRRLRGRTHGKPSSTRSPRSAPTSIECQDQASVHHPDAYRKRGHKPGFDEPPPAQADPRLAPMVVVMTSSDQDLPFMLGERLGISGLWLPWLMMRLSHDQLLFSWLWLAGGGCSCTRLPRLLRTAAHKNDNKHCYCQTNASSREEAFAQSAGAKAPARNRSAARSARHPRRRGGVARRNSPSRPRARHHAPCLGTAGAARCRVEVGAACGTWAFFYSFVCRLH